RTREPPRHNSHLRRPPWFSSITVVPSIVAILRKLPTSVNGHPKRRTRLAVLVLALKLFSPIRKRPAFGHQHFHLRSPISCCQASLKKNGIWELGHASNSRSITPKSAPTMRMRKLRRV